MSDTVTETPETVDNPTPAPKPGPKSDELPKWARDSLTKANEEAASARVQLREEQAARASLQEQVVTLTTEKTAAQAAASEVQADFDKVVVSINAGVPHDRIFAFAKTLQGSTLDELSAHATELKSIFSFGSDPEPAVDRSQGYGNPTSSGPAEQFADFLKQSLGK